jgi:hypothetical protein
MNLLYESKVSNTTELYNVYKVIGYWKIMKVNNGKLESFTLCNGQGFMTPSF